MAATDALPIPRKNVAFRLYFEIIDADGDLVTGATSLDSEVSKDGAAFADCTNEATEVATASGVYFLDLTSAEMNADAVCIKTTSVEGKPVVIVLYPALDSEIRVNVLEVNGVSAAAVNLAIACGVMVPGTCNAAGGTTTTCPTDLTESTTDHYKGRRLIFTSGALKDQATEIAGYNGTTKVLTFVALTEAVPNGAAFVIV